jgi:hypothetical protein
MREKRGGREKNQKRINAPAGLVCLDLRAKHPSYKHPSVTFENVQTLRLNIQTLPFGSINKNENKNVKNNIINTYNPISNQKKKTIY